MPALFFHIILLEIEKFINETKLNTDLNKLEIFHKAELRRKFDKIDTDNDGFINFEEYTKFTKNFAVFCFHDEETSNMFFKDIDFIKNGRVSFEGFYILFKYN